MWGEIRMKNYNLEQVQPFLEELNTKENMSLFEYATRNKQAIRLRRLKTNDSLRSSFSVDIDKILHNVFYNRYADKTQVFSFYRNDDITRRALHVQLVARIAHIIGHALSLNLDLIEAIALGHDIGHTPFGHKGEAFLNDLYYKRTKRYFSHNVHSVRVLKDITNSNLTVQTYDGILCHCGESVFDHYEPVKPRNAQDFEDCYERCNVDRDYIKELRPSTLEGCVVRISDIIAYVGKDRQDAYKAGLTDSESFKNNVLGKSNAAIITSVSNNLVKNSMHKNYLKMDDDVYESLLKLKKENFSIIYEAPKVVEMYKDVIQPMMEKVYERLLSDLEEKNEDSPIYKHHLEHKIIKTCYKNNVVDNNQIVVDYIASMTDDYFIDLYKFLFPKDFLNEKIQFHSYFDDCINRG